MTVVLAEEREQKISLSYKSNIFGYRTSALYSERVLSVKTINVTSNFLKVVNSQKFWSVFNLKLERKNLNVANKSSVGKAN